MFACSVRTRSTGTGYRSVDFNRSDFLRAKLEVLEEMRANPEYIEANITEKNGKFNSIYDRIFLKDEAGAILSMTHNQWAARYAHD